MTISSMTGFARSEGGSSDTSWVWEARSVNGRGLDVRLRLPSGLDGLEPVVREACAKYLHRGNVQLNLQVQRTTGTTVVRLNEEALRQVMEAASRAAVIAGGGKPSLDTLLAQKGVLEITERQESEEERSARQAVMLATLDDVLRRLVEARRSEGRKLRAVLDEHLERIERLVADVAASPARTPDMVQQRIREQLARLVQDTVRLDDGRIYQEAVLQASRADVEEELKRLTAHVASARELLLRGGAVGRQLDFLTQEFNREANTLCSKSNDAAITRDGLALKTVIDQMREQVQNIE
jgi:uncharacterized protein (TIGR00255 family)